MSVKRLANARSIAVLLSLALLLAMAPLNVLATNETPPTPSEFSPANTGTPVIQQETDTTTPPALPVVENPVPVTQVASTPVISLAANVANIGNVPAFEVTGTADETTTVVIRASDSDTKEVTATVTFNGSFSEQIDLSTLKDGVIAFKVYTESNGTETLIKDVTITKDTQAPAGNITSPVNGSIINNKTPQLTYALSESGTVTGVFIDGVATNKRNGDTLNALADGPHEVAVQVLDVAGNGSTARSVFMVDATAPAVTINSPIPGSIVNTSTPTLNFSVSETSAVTVKVGGAAVNKKSGDKLDALTDGSHTVVVEATDTAGNRGSAQASFTVSTQTLLTVAGTDPAVNATSVDKAKTVAVTFSDNIQEGTATAYSGVTLAAGTTPVAVTKSISGKTLSLDPAADLSLDTTYTVTIPAGAVKNAAGVMLAAPYSFSFKTQSGLPPVPVSAPAGLKVVSNKGMIELAWNPSTEATITGYNVYRRLKESTATATKLTTSTVTSVTYQDKTAQIGKTYIYYVTMVSATGVESPKSNEVEAALADVKSQIVFSDVPLKATYKSMLDKLIARGAFDVPADGKFHPDKKITRAEFAKVVYFIVGGKLGAPSKPSFKDVDAKHWAFQYIEKLNTQKIMIGYPNGTFRPQNSISRAEAAKVVTIIRKLPAATTKLKDIGSHWAKSFINSAVGAGVLFNVGSDNNFNPNGAMTRAEAINTLDKTIK